MVGLTCVALTTMPSTRTSFSRCSAPTFLSEVFSGKSLNRANILPTCSAYPTSSNLICAVAAELAYPMNSSGFSTILLANAGSKDMRSPKSITKARPLPIATWARRFRYFEPMAIDSNDLKKSSKTSSGPGVALSVTIARVNGQNHAPIFPSSTNLPAFELSRIARPPQRSG